MRIPLNVLLVLTPINNHRRDELNAATRQHQDQQHVKNCELKPARLRRSGLVIFILSAQGAYAYDPATVMWSRLDKESD